MPLVRSISEEKTIAETATMRSTPYCHATNLPRLLSLAVLLVVVLCAHATAAFLIYNKAHDSCLTARGEMLELKPCNNQVSQKWRWGTHKRLVHEHAVLCLTVVDRTYVGLSRCTEVELQDQQWECGLPALLLKHGTLKKLVVRDGKPALDVKPDEVWTIFGEDSDICKKLPTEKMYTMLGTGRGQPCVFPFEDEGNWFIDCAVRGRQSWCATTLNHSRQHEWGFCTSAAPGCSDFWKHNPKTGVCYQFNNGAQLGWYEASQSCKQQGAELISFADNCEHEYISGVLHDEQSFYWIGLYSAIDAGWQWTDRSPVYHFHWSTGPPSNRSGGQACGVLNPVTFGTWQIHDCNNKFPYICKKRDSTTKPTTMSLAPREDGFCARGWHLYDDACFKASRSSSSWDKARMECQITGGDLASIHSLAQHDFLLIHLDLSSEDKLWIGLNDRQNEMLFVWSDHSPVSFTSWQHYEPNGQQESEEDCVYMHGKDARWVDGSCKLQLGYVCQQSRTASTPQPTVNGNCLQGWRQYEQFCYLFVNKPYTFNEAENICKEKQSTLVSVGNRFEQAFLNSLVGDVIKNGAVWLGQTDRDHPGTFSWTDGTALMYSHWNKDQPGVMSGCVTMAVGLSLGLWDVRNCEATRGPLVCKARIIGYTTTERPATSPTEEGTQCAENWVTEAKLSVCFQINKVEESQHRTWDKAREHCVAQGGDLLSMDRHQEEDFIIAHLTPVNEGAMEYGYWYNMDHINYWTGLHYQDPHQGAKWSDGTLVNREFERSVPPGYCGTVAGVVKMGASYMSCDNLGNWICEIQKGKDVKKGELTPTEVYSSDGWKILGEWEYLYHQNKSLPFEKARQTCREERGELTSFHSQEELMFARQMVFQAGSPELWIGLRLKEGKFKWVDRTEMNFTYWTEGEPNNYGLEEHCGSMSNDNVKWNDRNCGISLSFLCKRHGMTSQHQTVEPFTTRPRGRCFPGWFSFQLKCFKIHGYNESELVPWVSANLVCHSKGAQLTTISNAVEEAFLLSLIGTNIHTKVWIGLSDQNKDRDFVWTDNSPLVYSNWAEGEPSFDSNDCVFMNPVSGQWKLEGCHTSNSFICYRYEDPLLEPQVTPSPGAMTIDGRTYTVIKEPSSWWQARQACSDIGDKLATVPDVIHQAFLTVRAAYLGRSLWIGLRSNKTGTFFWQDSSEVVYTGWTTQPPHTSESCVLVRPAGTWEVAPCSQQHFSVCQRVKENVLVNPEVEVEVICPNSTVEDIWLAFRKSCYLVHTDHPKSWSMAVRHCMSHGATLGSIHTLEENAFILKQVTKNFGEEKPLWIGLFRINEVMHWTDDSLFNFSNWASGEPTGYSTDCTHMNSAGKWILQQCRNHYSYVCKLPREMLKMKSKQDVALPPHCQFNLGLP
uniref:macrophage mannose receptor 1-like isoform X2 n=1 Tax=Myxine glutinosa TaxID=7769 RepID=UPI00359023F9